MKERERIKERLLSNDFVALTDYVGLDLDKNLVTIKLERLLDFIEEEKQRVVKTYTSWKDE